MVADHLSRINIAPSSIPISEQFPDEQLLSVSIEPWYADIVNYLVTGDTPVDWSNQDKYKFLSQVRNFFWDDPYLLNIVLTKSSDVVSQIMNFKASSLFVMIKLVEDILGQRKLPPKCSNVVSIGPLFFGMHSTIANAAIGANNWVAFLIAI